MSWAFSWVLRWNSGKISVQKYIYFSVSWQNFSLISYKSNRSCKYSSGFFGRKIKIYSVYACKISAVFCVNYLPYNVSACSVLCLFCYVFCICLSPACLATVQYWCPHWPSCHCYHHGWRSFEKGFFSGEVSILYKLFSDILLILVIDAYSQDLSR